MTEYWYLDVTGRVLGSLQAWTFRDAHAWLTRQGIAYHTVTKYQPRVRKSRERRVAKQVRRFGELAL